MQGEQFKVKLPFSGSGPFDVKIKKNGREVSESDNIKISAFDDFVTLIIRGQSMLENFVTRIIGSV